MAPVVPGFTTQTAKLEATIKACADHGAAFMGANVLYLKGGTKDHFMGFLATRFPTWSQGYERLYPARTRRRYVSRRALIDMLRSAR
jgi:DNA repair photolyase